MVSKPKQALACEGSKELQELQIFLYKNKLNEISITDLFEKHKFSSTTIINLLKDLKVIEPNSNDTFYIFCDGGAQNGKAGFSVYFGKNEYSKFNETKIIETLETPTNNIAELNGIKLIFTIIFENIELFKHQNKQIIIVSDSMYSINCIEKWSKNWLKNGWLNSKKESVKNKELIKEILDLRDKIDIKILFKHVSSHQKEPDNKDTLEYVLWYGNDLCDRNINDLLQLQSETGSEAFKN